MTAELKPIYDSRKSFYGKATITEDENGKTLTSYSTTVARIQGDSVKVYGTYSATTLRHIKEFLKQNGFRAESKAQIEADYLV